MKQALRNLRLKLEAGFSWTRKAAPAALAHLLFLGGLGGISFGVWMIYHPAGFIVGGVSSVWVSMLIAGEDGSVKRR